MTVSPTSLRIETGTPIVATNGYTFGGTDPNPTVNNLTHVCTGGDLGGSMDAPTVVVSWANASGTGVLSAQNLGTLSWLVTSSAGSADAENVFQWIGF